MDYVFDLKVLEVLACFGVVLLPLGQLGLVALDVLLVLVLVCRRSAGELAIGSSVTVTLATPVMIRRYRGACPFAEDGPQLR